MYDKTLAYSLWVTTIPKLIHNQKLQRICFVEFNEFKLDPRVNVNEKAPSGNTPLHAAINTGNINMVKLLINAGANVNAWNPECEGATPLHLAIMSGKYYCL